MKNLVLMLVLLSSLVANSQRDYKYYMYLSSDKVAPNFMETTSGLRYVEENRELALFFRQYTVAKFEKAFPKIPSDNIQRVFILQTPDKELARELTTRFSSIFIKSEEITHRKFTPLSYPNDYGVTSPVPNLGAAADRRDLDYINAPDAWDITTGSTDVVIGISDTGVDDSLPDLAGKTSYVTGYNGSGRHGTTVAALAAAQGNNASGTVGICYDCSILASGYSPFCPDINNCGYTKIYELASQGAQVINMSWYDGVYYSTVSEGYFQVEQDIINLVISDFGTILVAASGNVSSYTSPEAFIDRNGDGAPDYPFGQLYVFPACYDNVISVSNVFQRFPELNADSYDGVSPWGYHIYLKIHDSVSPNVDGTDLNNPIGLIHNGWNVSEANPIGLTFMLTTNEIVDIVAPGFDMFNYYDYGNDGIINNSAWGTSFAAPLVTGTIGLMLDLNECLTPVQVETILKLSSKDIEHDLLANDVVPSSLNQNFYGNIGAGKLEVGHSTKFVKELGLSNGNAEVKDHIFYRNTFELDNIMNKLTLDNVRFVQDATAEFNAKNCIELLEGTVLEPKAGSYVSLDIDSNITACSSSRSFSNKDINRKIKNNNGLNYKVLPTIINTKTEISKLEFQGKFIKSIKVFNILGREVAYFKDINSYSYEANLSFLIRGVYVLKVFDKENRVVHTQKIIKK